MTTLQLFTAKAWYQAAFAFAQGFIDLLRLVGLVLLARLLPAPKLHRCSRE